MKRFILSIYLLATTFLFLSAQEETTIYKHNIFLTGASFATSNNSWFEMGCERLNANPINKAVGGHAIANTANLMVEGKLYSMEELEKTDAFVIMHVHNMDVYDTAQIRKTIEEYKLPFDRSNYAAAYDYAIKKYITDCYNLKFNPQSKYYESKTGKPPVIILCTHWNDSRTIYNESVRKLAQKWGFPLVEFDKYIGFSNNQDHPVTGEAFSLLYANDTQTVDGKKHGFHPVNGKDKHIQQRMAAIFRSLMRNVILEILP